MELESTSVVLHQITHMTLWPINVCSLYKSEGWLSIMVACHRPLDPFRLALSHVSHYPPTGPPTNLPLAIHIQNACTGSIEQVWKLEVKLNIRFCSWEIQENELSTVVIFCLIKLKLHCYRFHYVVIENSAVLFPILKTVILLAKHKKDTGSAFPYQW